MAGNQFLLPDELGWECNDEISACVDKWVNQISDAVDSAASSDTKRTVWSVAKAELMDDIYAIIKKYQGDKK